SSAAKILLSNLSPNLSAYSPFHGRKQSLFVAKTAAFRVKTAAFRGENHLFPTLIPVDGPP
ncbi:MAG: hypothetical protein ACI3YB_06760, partial [Prevotella sp.]